MIVVKAARLKSVFTVIKSILDKSELSKTIRLNTNDNILTIIVNTDVRYTANIDILEASKDNTDAEVSILYRDIAKLIDGRGNAKVNLIHDVGITIETVKATLDLEASLDKLNDVLYPLNNEHLINGHDLSNALTSMRSFPAYSRHFQQEVPILLSGDSISLRYNTLYCQIKGLGIKTVLDLECAKMLQVFLQDSETVYLSEDTDRYIFRVNTDLFAISKQEPAHVKNVADFLKDFKYIGALDVPGFIAALKDVAALTKEEVTVKIYNNTVQITALIDGSKLTVRTSELNSKSILLDSFIIYADSLLNILSVIGSVFEYYRKDSSIGFVRDETIVLASSRG